MKTKLWKTIKSRPYLITFCAAFVLFFLRFGISSIQRGKATAFVLLGIFQNSFIKRVKNQLVVISVTNNIADDSPVTQIENRTQIELVDNWTFIPLELRYIGQPLFVGMPRPEFPVQTILCCYLRVRSISGTTLFSELHG